MMDWGRDACELSICAFQDRVSSFKQKKSNGEYTHLSVRRMRVTAMSRRFRQASQAILVGRYSSTCGTVTVLVALSLVSHRG
jgi:hypothetical protein